MRFYLALFTGKLFVFFIKLLRLGSGSTWPGHISLSIDPRFNQNLLKKSRTKVIMIAGTNGKTTTARLIQYLLSQLGKSAFHNASGANLQSAVATSLIQHASLTGSVNHEYAIFELDENTLPHVLPRITPHVLVLLNLFRDQLDRYGEVTSIARKWEKSLQDFSADTVLVLNVDDPQIASLGEKRKNKTLTFGLSDKSSSKNDSLYLGDSTYCPSCKHKLTFKTTFFSHLGDWSCPSCKRKRPTLDVDTSSSYPLSGRYNKYNTHAAIATLISLGFSEKDVNERLHGFTPAFGRQEKITYRGKKVQLFLSKNPTSFNQSLETIMQENPKSILFVLNDQIPDGRDVSWIWDTEVERYDFKKTQIFTSGDRTFDMALRLKYAHPAIEHVDANPDLASCTEHALDGTAEDETLFVLPTYSAMLDVRKILTGKRIL